MAEVTNNEAQRKRMRSPAYPSIDLETAIDRVGVFYEREKRNRANVSVALGHWGYGKKSGLGMQLIAALKAFGLMDTSGSGENRTVILTTRALKITLDHREKSPEREALIREAALLPKIHRSLWEDRKGDLGSDDNLCHHLIFEHEPPFNENSVNGFIRELLATLAFAKLDGSDTISEEGKDTGKNETGDGDSERPTQIKVGDYVQWESQGVLQFKEPKRVRQISEDGEWAFVEGSNTGVRVDELAIEKRPESVPPIGDQMRPADGIRLRMEGARPGLRQDLFSLDEGNVTIQWPDPLSQESFEDLKAYIEISLRKIERSVKKP